MGDDHGGIEVASSWNLHGWSPTWTRATVTLRGLKSPSTWTYDGTTYQNHAKKSPCLHCVCLLQTLPFTFICNVLLSGAALFELHV